MAASSTYLLGCCYFTLHDAVNYANKFLSLRLFFPSNSLIHLTSLHPRYSNGNSSSLLGQFKIYQPERCMLNISIFPFFFFSFSEQLPAFHSFCFLFWVYPGCLEYSLSMTTQLCFSISLQYPTQYRYVQGIKRN